MPSPQLFGLHSSKPRATEPGVSDIENKAEGRQPELAANSPGIRNLLGDLWRRATRIEPDSGA